jgi:hypoxanthine phosphoribosyltransferase
MSKKDTNIVVVDDIQLKESIEKYKNLLDESKELEKQTTSISKKIKEIAEDKWIELYNEIGENPGSIVLEAQDDFDGTSASIPYTPMNRFKSVTDKNKEEIRSVIG